MTNDDNPLGLNGFEFVELTGPDPAAFADIFESLGFTDTATHRSKNARLDAQGNINFLLNMDAVGHVAHFREQHGPSANAMGFASPMQTKHSSSLSSAARRRSRAKQARPNSMFQQSKALAERICTSSTAAARRPSPSVLVGIDRVARLTESLLGGYSQCSFGRQTFPAAFLNGLEIGSSRLSGGEYVST
jgi:Hydroxyphenylpyruvate dioxygenase, HPPD, N-terminal